MQARAECGPTEAVDLYNCGCLCVLLADGGWQSAQDGKGRTYYFNKTLRISQYESPFEIEFPSPLPPPPMDSGKGKAKSARTTSSNLIPSLSCSSPEASSSSLRKMTSVPYDIQQLLRERARLRAMVSHVSGKEKADILGEIAAIESDLQYY